MARLRIFLANLGMRAFSNYWVVPPMGILMLAAYLREKMPAVLMLVNQRLENWNAHELACRATAFEADVVGLSALTPNAYLLPDIIASIRATRPGTFIVVGGPHASAVGASLLDMIDADAAVPGEGEVAFEQAIRARFDGGSLAEVPGLIWRGPDGTVVTNPGNPGIVEDLDNLPMPAYDLIDLSKYWHHQTISPIRRRRYVSLLSSRGCPYRCMWCHSIFGKHIRMHSAERIVEEIKWFRRQYDVDDIEFIDDTFNYDHERVLAVCDLLRKNNLRLKLSVPNGIRGDMLNQNVVDALAEAGLYHCMIALESGSPRIQKLTRKNLNLSKFLHGCEMMARRGVYIHTCCMLGFPTETEAELQQTIDVACEAKSHTTSFFTVTPFPGTPLYDFVKERSPEKLAALCYDGETLNTIKLNLTDLPDEVLFAYQRKANRQYYLNANRLFRLLRDHPQPWALPLYAPLLVRRALSGILG